ncbi:MAG: two component, sigma54 specific, transcriptional regulator, Fis family [Myxococcales bacterium]|nr:two component, sigma54 specific, transcriptional regulator, Fis family [Myxococcales bacterium]
MKKRSSMKTTSILVVDDDPDWRATLTDVLVSEGYAVALAENGREALALLSPLEPCVVVTDLQMPIMDGEQLLKALAKRGHALPVIVVTADPLHSSTKDLACAFRVMSKPITPDALVAAVAEADALVTSPLPPVLRRLARTAARHRTPIAAFLLATAVVSSVALVNHLRLALGSST